MCRSKTLGSPFSVSIESPICQEPRHCATVASLSTKRLHGRFHNRHNANGTIAINQPFQTIRRNQGKALTDGSQDDGLPARGDRASQLPIPELQKHLKCNSPARPDGSIEIARASRPIPLLFRAAEVIAPRQHREVISRAMLLIEQGGSLTKPFQWG